MERCDGGCLSEYVFGENRTYANHTLSGGITEDDLKIVFYNLTQAIKECHNRKIAHLDIRLGNIEVVNEDNLDELRLSNFHTSIDTKVRRNWSINEMFLKSSCITCAKHCKPSDLNGELIMINNLVYVDYYQLGMVGVALLTASHDVSNLTKEKLPHVSDDCISYLLELTSGNIYRRFVAFTTNPWYKQAVLDVRERLNSNMVIV
jgi:serine/threonine protein kinase